MKSGDLIAINGSLYEYGSYDEKGKLHIAFVIDIDEDGRLTHTYNGWYFTDEELANNKIDLTLNQWCGLVAHFIREDYDLTEEEIEDAADDIVCRCLSVTGVPLVEELPNYIAEYMDR